MSIVEWGGMVLLFFILAIGVLSLILGLLGIAEPFWFGVWAWCSRGRFLLRRPPRRKKKTFPPMAGENPPVRPRAGACLWCGGEPGQHTAQCSSVNAMAQWRAELQRLQREKDARIYYQNIVYAVCNALDRINGDGVKAIVCGTLETPTTEVEFAVDKLTDEVVRLREFALLIRDDFDCDSDAHKYGTPCRCCEAKHVIALGESDA